jgi:hypothetical protein
MFFVNEYPFPDKSRAAASTHLHLNHPLPPFLVFRAQK